MPAGVYWAGTVGAAQYATLQRSCGLEPDVAMIQFSETQFREWVPQLDMNRFRRAGEASLPALVAELRNGITFRSPTSQDPAPYAGTLALVEDDVSTLVVSMYLDAVRVVEDGTPQVVEVTLADVRRFWRTYGEVTKEFNVQRKGGGYQFYSLRGEGENRHPWTLRELCEFFLDRLPGRPVLVEFPPGAEPLRPRTLRCWGARPVEALAQLISDYDLEFALNLDGSASIYESGAGVVGETSGSKGGKNEPADWDYISDRSRRVRNDKPESVVVVGGRRVWTAAIDYMIPILLIPLSDDDGTGTPRVLDVTPAAIEALIAAELEKIHDAEVDAQEDLGDLPLIPAAGPAPAEDVWKLELTRPEDSEGWKATWGAELAAYNAETASSYLTANTPPQVEPMLQTAVIDYLLRLPLARSNWDGVQGVSVPEKLRDLLSRQLFRFYRIPSEFRHLLSLRKRGEIRNDGSRMPITVEAFTFDKKLVPRTVSEEELSAAEKAKADALKQWQVVSNLIAWYENEIKRLRILDGAELFEFFHQGIWNSAWGDERGLSARVDGDVRINLAGSTIENLDWISIGELIVQGDEGSITSRQVIDSLWRMGPGRFAGWVGLADIDKKSELVAVYEQELNRQRVLQAKLLKIWDPLEALQKEIIALGEVIRSEESFDGVLRTRLRAQLAAMQEKHSLLLREARDGPAKPPEMLVHVNSYRKPVPYRVIDAQEGIVEVLGDLPGWLEDPFVSSESETRFSPMPVRIIFGTSNTKAHKVPTLTAQGENFWFRHWSEALQAASVDLEMLRDIGHVFPKSVGDDQTRLSFTPGDRGGDAPESDHPWLIRAGDLRILTGLPTPLLPNGPTNRPEVIAAARDLANAVFRQPEYSRIGEVTIRYPRPVNPNGRVAAVQWTMSGGGWTTTVSLNSGVEPFPGLRRARRLRGQAQHWVGLNEEGSL